MVLVFSSPTAPSQSSPTIPHDAACRAGLIQSDSHHQSVLNLVQGGPVTVPAFLPLLPASDSLLFSYKWHGFGESSQCLLHCRQCSYYYRFPGVSGFFSKEILFYLLFLSYPVSLTIVCIKYTFKHNNVSYPDLSQGLTKEWWHEPCLHSTRQHGSGAAQPSALV